jgi:ubiquinone/menaquinone biosynthesis C-methylase UbiE
VAASLVLERLGDGGHLTAIDRSQKMVDAATERNRKHVDAGRATFICTTFEEADFGDAKFDVVFGIHFPPLLRHDPEGTTERVTGLVAPGGRVAWF